jgi:hypothetical protein
MGYNQRVMILRRRNQMKHSWLVAFLASVMLAGGVVGAPPKPAAVPTAETVLGTVTIPRAVTADGKPLAKGTYQVRLTAQAAQPTVAGQLPDLNRWVEFVQGGQVKGREVVSIIPADEVQQTQAGPDLDPGKAPRTASKVEALKGGEYMRVWIARQGVQYLLHLPVGAA